MNSTLNATVGSTTEFRSDVCSDFHIGSVSEFLTTEAVDRVCKTDHKDNDNIPDVTPAATSRQGRALVLDPLLTNAASHSRRAGPDPQGDGRGSAKELDEDRHPVPHPGAQEPSWRGEPRHLLEVDAGAVDQGASQGGQTQGVPGHLLHGCAGHEAQWERGDEQDGDARHGNYHEEVSGGAAGLGRLREALHPELPDDPERVQGLRPLGRNDMAREWRRGRGSAPGSPARPAKWLAVQDLPAGTQRPKAPTMADGYLTKEALEKLDKSSNASGSTAKEATSNEASHRTERLEKTLEAMADTMEARCAARWRNSRARGPARVRGSQRTMP